MSTLSVVVPAYNEEELIGRCLDSLLAQTRPIDEIIVVDNGSTDATPQIVDRYAEQHSSIIRVVEHEPGVIAARRRGFDEASSDLIAKTDADSLVDPEWAERIVAFFDSNLGRDYAGLTGLVLIWDGPSDRLQRRLAMMTIGPLANGGETGSLQGANYVVRRAVWLRLRDGVQTAPDIWEDLDLGLTLAEAGERMYYDPNVRVESSCRQLRHSPWENRTYISGGVRTARGRNNAAAAKILKRELPFRYIAFTFMWLLFRPWDPEKQNWRPHRIFTRLERGRDLATTRRKSE